jgi:hypothetical protein
VTFHNANWKADYLVNPVQISQATLQLGNGEIRWDPVVFSYGPVKGTASLTVPANCGAPEPCLPHFEVQFGDLDASAFQAAILGAQKRGTLLSTLIDRLHPSSAPPWPQLEGEVKANSLIMGPVTLRELSAVVRILPTGAEIGGFGAGVLGGHVDGSATLRKAATDRDKPAYTLEGRFSKLNASAVGQLLGQHWSGGTFDANGKIDLSGYTGKDLASSAKGALHFEWGHGAIGGQVAAASKTASVPPALVHFDRWAADAAIANGTITLGQNQVQRGGQQRAVEGALTFGEPAKASFTAPRETQTEKR